MPLVGNKHFAYTPEGMKKALAHAEKTGQKVKVDKKGIGGMVKKYSQGGMLKGPSHKKGGIPAVVKGSGQPIEMEGGEYVIKKDSAQKLGPDILNYINKTGSVPKMQEGGPVNPYLKDFRAAEKTMFSTLDELSQQDEELERNKHSKQGSGFGGFGQSGESKYRMHMLKKQGALKFRDREAKKLRERAKARGGVAEFEGSKGLAARGALRARGDQKAAYRIIKEESQARKDAYDKRQDEAWAAKRAAWSNDPRNKFKHSWENPYKGKRTRSMFSVINAPRVYKHGGSVNDIKDSIFSLLKKTRK
tara:strand:- start:467 stop:1378 length:912 start_codon:yes stop_codon:yes gene_type:complete